MFVSHRWVQIKRQVLQRRLPHTVMSWRFLLPNQSSSVQLHRRVFLNAWPNLPRWQWALIALYSYMAWLLVFSWLQSYRCIKGRKIACQTYPCHLPVWKQVFDLLQLTLLDGVAPHYYYRFGLFRKPRSQWLDYVFTLELPHWHEVLAAEVGDKTRQLMSDKGLFAEHMREHGIATVETCAYFKKGGGIEPNDLFIERSLFLKPDHGSRSVGCCSLLFDRDTGEYRLHTDSNQAIDCQNKIIAEINRLIQLNHYLIQPRLENHQLITALCGEGWLVTLRLITGVINSQPVALFATLEKPYADSLRDCYCMNVDLSSGILSNRLQGLDSDYQKFIDQLEGETLPLWQEAIDICLKAHQQCLDLPSIGWDVAITPSGVKLLEGNFNWGIEQHQILLDEPALNTRLIDVYQGISGN